MNKALSLVINTITVKLKEYYFGKDGDPAILLPKRYHEYLDIFS